MIEKFEFCKNNIVYKEDEYTSKGEPKKDRKRSSHKLGNKSKKGLNRFITFDTESTSEYYYKDKIITRHEYYQLDEYDINKYEKFYIKTIQACFCTPRSTKRKVYILGSSVFKEPSIKFSFRNTVTQRFTPISAEIIYHQTDIVKLFMDDVISFSTTGDKTRHNMTEIFCHNGKHDWLQIELFNFHKKFNLEIKSYNLTTPRFCVWKIKYKFMISFIDTTNYFKQSLESIGDEIGIPKQKEFIDFTKGFEVDENFIKYGIIDAEILSIKMRNYNQLVTQYGKLGYGVPSTAYNIWLSSFMDEKIWLHKNPKLMSLERKSFYGGRTEAFKLGYYSNMFGIDINSSYPYQMEQELPCSYDFSISSKDEYIPHKKYNSLKKTHMCLCEVIIDSNLEIPIIPHHFNNKLIFINGDNIEKVLCQPEIDLLIESGSIVKFKSIHCYKKGYPMKRFSKHFMKMKVEAKEKGNIELSNFGKLNANSSYGKTAERYIESTIEDCDINLIGNINIKIPELKKNIMFKHLAGKMVRSEKKNFDGDNAYCILGSFITSYARCHLYKAMVKIGRKNLVYCDTDSIYFINNNNIIETSKIDFDPFRVGAWDIEDKNISMVVYGAKDYYKFDGQYQIKQKLKGISLNNSNQIDENIYIIKQWQGFGYALKSNDIGHQYITRIKKELKREYTKAIINNPSNKKSFSFKGYIKDNKLIDYDKEKTLNFIQSDLIHFNLNQLI